jgi:ribosome-binding protein aMBF1 (putative translation factor)
MTEHRQDWEPIIIKSRKSKTNTQQSKNSKGDVQTVVRHTSPNASTTAKLPKSLLNDFDPENVPSVLMTSNNLSSAMRIARNARVMPNGLPMTQSDLDKESQVPKNTVRNYENGSAVYNSDHVNKIARTLGVTLPRPKRQ